MNPYYQDSAITIYHGDCREIVPEIGQVDLVLTDPPYGHNQGDGDLAHNRERALGIRANTPADARPILNDGPEANDLVRWLFAQAKLSLRHGGCCCCCCCCGGGGPDPQFARWSLWMDELLGFKQMVVWDKGGLGMGWHYRRNYEVILVGEKPGAACKWYGGNSQSNVVRISGIKPSAFDHPTPKPVELMGLFINLHSLPGELVLDPFCGGGSTLRAAKDLNRKAIGIDLDERWCELSAKRCAQEVLL